MVFSCEQFTITFWNGFLPQFEHNEYMRLLISHKIYKPAVHKGTNCKIKLSGLLLAFTFVILSNNVENEYNNEVILYIYVAYLPQIISTESIQLSAHTTLPLQFWCDWLNNIPIFIVSWTNFYPTVKKLRNVLSNYSVNNHAKEERQLSLARPGERAIH